MIKVLMITGRFIYGGIEKLLMDIFEYNDNPDIHYDVLALNSEADQQLLDRLKLLGVGYSTLALDKVKNKRGYHYKRLYEILLKEKYDVVHVNITNYRRAIDLLVAKRAGVRKRIIHAHSAGIKNPLSKEIYRPIRKLFDFVATDFFACSDAAAKYLFSNRTVRERRYRVIKNGIDLSDYEYSDVKRKELRASLGIDESTLLVGHVGRLTEAKNHAFLLEVFAELNKELPNSKLVIVGDGELKGAIERQINELKLDESVILYGSTSNVSAVLSAIDVFIFPSLWEGLGISVIEAQCNGLPCYVSERIPLEAVITDNTYQLRLDDTPEHWSEIILSKENIRMYEKKKLIDSGFDIRSTVELIQSVYLT